MRKEGLESRGELGGYSIMGVWVEESFKKK